MGGPESAGYRNFVDLTIKAFLSARLYAKQIVHTTSQMLSAEFPSFKGEPTMDRLLERFRLDLNEKDAAKYMISVIDNAYENRMSIVYDYFASLSSHFDIAGGLELISLFTSSQQLKTNGQFSFRCIALTLEKTLHILLSICLSETLKLILFVSFPFSRYPLCPLIFYYIP